MKQEQEERYFVKQDWDGKLVEVLEVYESYPHWYWFITEKETEPTETEEGTDFVYFGKVIGFETEWGEIWMGDIHKEMKRGYVWNVPKSAWSSISHIITGDKSSG